MARIGDQDCAEAALLSDPRIVSIRDALDPAAIDLLLTFPADGTSIALLPPEAEPVLARLMDLAVADPAGLVAFRAQLVETCQGGVRLARLGRAIALAVRAQG